MISQGRIRVIAACATALAVAAPAVPAEAARHDRPRPTVEGLTGPDGAPGALAELRDRRGRRQTAAAGVADIRTGAPVHPGSPFRIGSLTKPFTATVVLQLADERRVDLDAPVERYLPGVVRGGGNDGRRITVRQLLQHTSGLPNVLDHLTPADILADPLRHWEARELVDIALRHPPEFEPGKGWSYSNTGYLLAGMIIERVTGRPYGAEIHRRVIAPLGLRDTVVPGDEPGVPGPHLRGYVRPGSDLVDMTRLNPSVAGAAGNMISTASDLDRFFAALLRGRLLKPERLREMMRTRPTGQDTGSAYGLGLQWFPVTDRPGCARGFWGHGGDMIGFSARTGAVNGRQATVMVNLNPGGGPALKEAVNDAFLTTLCGPRR